MSKAPTREPGATAQLRALHRSLDEKAPGRMTRAARSEAITRLGGDPTPKPPTKKAPTRKPARKTPARSQSKPSGRGWLRGAR